MILTHKRTLWTVVSLILLASAVAAYLLRDGWTTSPVVEEVAGETSAPASARPVPRHGERSQQTERLASRTRICGDFEGLEPRSTIVRASRLEPGAPAAPLQARVEGDEWTFDIMPGRPLVVTATSSGLPPAVLNLAAPKPCTEHRYRLVADPNFEGVTLTGHVGDALGGPIEAAEVVVRALGTATRPGYLAPPFATATDVEGNFALVLPAGRYAVSASFPGYATAGKSIDLGQEVSKPAHVELQLVGGATIAGRVLFTDDRSPVAYASIRVWPATSGEPYVNHGAAADGVSAIDGSFRIEGLSPGRWMLAASTHEGATQTPIEVDVALRDERSGVELLVDAGYEIGGRVHRAGAEEPVADANVLLQARGRAHTCSPSDDDGRFSCAGVLPGDYTAIVDKPGWVGDLQAARIHVDADRRDLDIALSPGVQLEGRVQPPTEGVEVHVRMDLADLASGPSIGAALMGAFKTATTDAEGRFSIGPLALGRATLVAEHAAAGRGTLAVSSADAEGELTLLLEQDARVVGWVEGPTPDALEGATLSLRADAPATTVDGARDPKAPQYQLRIDREGHFSSLSIEPGHYELQLSIDGQGVEYDGPTRIGVPSPEAENLRLGLTRQARRFGGTIVDDAGSPVAGVRVEALPGGDVLITDDDGRFEFSSWTAREQLEVRYAPSDAPHAVTGASLIAGEDAQLTLPSHGALQVLSPKGAEGQVSLFGPVAAQRPLDPDGSTELEGLALGEYELIACTNLGLDRRTIDLDATKTAPRVELELEDYARVQGVFRLDADAPSELHYMVHQSPDVCGTSRRMASASIDGDSGRTRRGSQVDIDGLAPVPTTLTITGTNARGEVVEYVASFEPKVSESIDAGSLEFRGRVHATTP